MAAIAAWHNRTESIDMNMHILIKLTLLLLFCILSGRPQLVAQTYAGVKTGVGATRFYTVGGEEQTFNYNDGISLPYALFVSKHLAGNWGLYAEVGHQLLGSRIKGLHPVGNFQNPSVFADCDAEIRLHYLATAFMVRYAYPIGNVSGIYLQVGPAPQFLIKAEEVDRGYGNSYPSETGTTVSKKYFDETHNASGNFQAINFAIAGSAGWCWRSNSEYVMIEVFANRGMQTVERDNSKARHVTSLCGFMIGYAVRL